MAVGNILEPSKGPSRSISQGDAIVIIGAGVFGLTTACELSKRGYTNITVLDRYPPPVRDGSSVDVSRVIRPDYADDFYAKLGMEAMESWQGEYSQYFHKSGLLCASSQGEHPYIEQSKANVERRGGHVRSFQSGQALQERFPAIDGDLSTLKGYLNPSCGWADAEGSIQYLARKCASYGVSFVCGPCGTVTSLHVEGNDVISINTQTGDTIRGDQFILATGAWSPYLIDMSSVSISNAQPVAFVQLTPKEAKSLSSNPVIIDLSTGWFSFPPTPDTHLLKMARHGYGYEVPRMRKSNVQFSAPALTKDNAAPNFLPPDAEKALRDGLTQFMPSLKDRPFCRRRMCWYTDTRKGDFIVDKHPSHTNLYMATGGSGQ